MKCEPSAKSAAAPDRYVEQMTLNQRVQGSSPCAPTNKINALETADLGLKKAVSAMCPH